MFYSGHIARQCRSNMKCFRCNNRHHISICESENNRSYNLNPNNTEQTNYSGVTAGIRDNTLLQTAMSTVSFNRQKLKVRILFDSCSQYSFINEDVRRKLKLPTIRKEKMVIKAFESKSETVRVLEVVKVKQKGWNNSYNEIYLYVVPLICSPLVGQTLEIAQAIHEHLIDLPLADSTEGCATLDIDILVGGNYYWQFFSGKVVRGRKGPVAMESCLGYVMS